MVQGWRTFWKTRAAKQKQFPPSIFCATHLTWMDNLCFSTRHFFFHSTSIIAVFRWSVLCFTHILLFALWLCIREHSLHKKKNETENNNEYNSLLEDDGHQHVSYSAFIEHRNMTEHEPPTVLWSIESGGKISPSSEHCSSIQTWLSVIKTLLWFFADKWRVLYLILSL